MFSLKIKYLTKNKVKTKEASISYPPSTFHYLNGNF